MSVTGKYSLISFSSHRARIHFSPQRRVSCRVTSCTTAVQSWTVGISIIGWHVVYRCVPLNTSPLSHLFHRYAKFERIAFDLLPRLVFVRAKILRGDERIHSEFSSGIITRIIWIIIECFGLYSTLDFFARASSNSR